jgi:hypothetical protein
MNKPNRLGASRRNPKPQPTRFIVCRHRYGCWIASETHGHVTGLFPIDIAVAGMRRKDEQRRRP